MLQYYQYLESINIQNSILISFHELLLGEGQFAMYVPSVMEELYEYINMEKPTVDYSVMEIRYKVGPYNFMMKSSIRLTDGIVYLKTFELVNQLERLEVDNREKVVLVPTLTIFYANGAVSLEDSEMETWFQILGEYCNRLKRYLQSVETVAN